MSASVAVLAQAKQAQRAAEAETVTETGREMDDQAKLAVAMEALSAIANETDLTCLRSLFRMHHRAEEALSRIRCASATPRPRS